VSIAKAKFPVYSSADYLDNEKVIAEYLAAAVEDANPDVFPLAVSSVAKARGIAKIAKDSGLGRESLYKTLMPGAKPRYEMLRKIVEALGVKWTIAKPSVKRRAAGAHA
jgi:probable addiction module antidote protein